jgi:hypothetical protein
MNSASRERISESKYQQEKPSKREILDDRKAFKLGKAS